MNLQGITQKYSPFASGYLQTSAENYQSNKMPFLPSLDTNDHELKHVRTRLEQWYRINAMATLRQMERYIRKRLKLKISKRQIGRELSISAAEVGRILEGKYPGEKVAKRLGIPVICFACHRRVSAKKLKQAAPKIGQPGWEKIYLKELK